MHFTELQTFVRASTRPASHPLLPEVRLHLTADVMSLWMATEAHAGGARPPPFWAIPWPGGVALGRYLLDHPGTVTGLTVLDFGAGSGVAAIAAAQVGARAQVADIDPFACAACAVNAAENQVSVEVLEGDPVEGGTWDVILAADVCYEKPVADRVIAWLRAQAATSLVLLADGGRAFRPTSGLVARATYPVDVDPSVEDCLVRMTGIWEVRPEPPAPARR